MVRRWCTGAEPATLRDNLLAVLERGERRGELPGGWTPDALAQVVFGTLLAVVIDGVAAEERRLDGLEADAFACLSPLFGEW